MSSLVEIWLLKHASRSETKRASSTLAFNLEENAGEEIHTVSTRNMRIPNVI